MLNIIKYRTISGTIVPVPYTYCIKPTKDSFIEILLKYRSTIEIILTSITVSSFFCRQKIWTMWNTWVDKASEVAKRAQEAAAQIEGQLNESVSGNKESKTHNATTISTLKTTISDAFFDDDDDGFYDDEDIIDTKEKESTHNNNDNGWEEEDDIEVEDIVDIDVDGTDESTNKNDEIPAENHPKVDLVQKKEQNKEEHVEDLAQSLENLNTIEAGKTVNENNGASIQGQEVIDAIQTKEAQQVMKEEVHLDDPSKKVKEEISINEAAVTITTEIKSREDSSMNKESSVDDDIVRSNKSLNNNNNNNNNDIVVKETNNKNEQVGVCVEKEGNDNYTDITNKTHSNNNESNDIKHDVIPQNYKQGSVSTSTTTTTKLNSNTSNDGQYEEKMLQMKENHEVEMTLLRSHILELQNQLTHRENQIASHVEQMEIINETNEAEKDELRSKIRETKEEAKRRIGKAKERVMEMEAKLKDTAMGVEHEKSIVIALRSEGEALAKKQSEMEQKVRESNHKINELNESLENETLAKETAQTKIVELEESLKKTQADLKAAKQGEVRADKLDGELLSFREQIAKKDASILTLESRLKEYHEQNDKLLKAVDVAEKNAVDEIKKEGNLLRQEKDKLLSDLELKLQTSENEAHEREESLRREISELRKRWQDAVRRADALNIDLQQSTAPLLRQLESVERQNRVKAATWAEVETKLRSDLEEYVVQHEQITKERNELLASNNRLERTLKEKEDDLLQSETKIEERIEEIDALETRNKHLEEEKKQFQRQLQKMHDKVKEVDSKVRAEMMKTVRESEDYYQKEIESLKVELHSERERASALHARVNELMSDSSSNTNNFSMSLQSDRKQQRLMSSENQVDILQNTLKGMDDDFIEMDDQIDDIVDTKMGGSYVHMEQLSQQLTHSKIEVEALKKQLRDMETRRDSLEKELSQHRKSAEKLPELQSQIESLQKELREKNMDLQSMTEDMEEVRQMYREQLDDLLEEKAMITPVKARPPPKEKPSDDQIIEVADGSGSITV